MRYKHIKTGAVIDSPSKIVGKGWELLDGEHVKKHKQEYVEEEINLEEMTNKELEDFAEEHGIELITADKQNKDTRINAIAKAFE